MEIEIKGYTVQIDEEDYERVTSLKWNTSLNLDPRNKRYFIHSYRDTTGKLCNISLHRFILGLIKYDGIICDHINGDTLDNRKSNLRKCNKEGNARNVRISKRNTTGYKGVVFHKRDKKYQANITVCNKKIHLGYYNTPEEAYRAYCKASEKYHGEFGRV
jgi:hypothetical protein